MHHAGRCTSARGHICNFYSSGLLRITYYCFTSLSSRKVILISNSIPGIQFTYISDYSHRAYIRYFYRRIWRSIPRHRSAQLPLCVVLVDSHLLISKQSKVNRSMRITEYTAIYSYNHIALTETSHDLRSWARLVRLCNHDVISHVTCRAVPEVHMQRATVDHWVMYRYSLAHDITFITSITVITTWTKTSIHLELVRNPDITDSHKSSNSVS